ncbi:cupin domain-containing protein [uncultured Cetobacterium sp.]|uniref:cupin domain-containing protein n=1 Tax=uncultured Cetobacterium sp. TaxID=527638 RepID=UPI0026296218|nr:cupin domain-containing protein [uncultured Cetobacterium sp.]
MSTFKNIQSEKSIDLKNLVPYSDNAINSIMLALTKDLNITIFSFDKNEFINEHSAPADALVYILEGELEISIDKKIYIVKENEMILMPAKVLHALKALDKSKMLLIIVKKEESSGGFINIDYSLNKDFTQFIQGFKGGIVSKRVINTDNLSSLLFDISNCEEIEHNQVEGETFILTLDGELQITTNENNHSVKKNQVFLVPNDTLYELKSTIDSKFLLIEIN